MLPRASAAAAVLVAMAAWVTAAAAQELGAPADTARSAPEPRPTIPGQPAPADTARAGGPAARGGEGPAPAGRDTTRAALADTIGGGRLAVDLDTARKRGDVTLLAALRGAQPTLLRTIPLFGAPFGSISLPDAGSPVRPAPPGARTIAATDRPLATLPSYTVGVWDLATSLDDPLADGVELLELTGIREGLEPGAFERAGELLAQPPADAALPRAMPGEARRRQRARSALYYGNGESGELATGARLVAPSLGWGVGGSFARHESDGITPLHHSKATRYALASGLPRVLDHDLWIEGRVFEWTLEDEAPVINPQTSELQPAFGRAEIMDQGLRLHGRAAGSRAASRWWVELAESKRTRVEALGARERWKFPLLSMAWDARLALDQRSTAFASVRGASQGIVYREGEAPLFDIRRESARARVGLARSLGPRSGVQADAAWDWRETEGSLVDGRLSGWTAGRRASVRLDVERAHERPTWVDLLAPERVLRDTTQNLARSLRLTRSGNPALAPRVLTGALARGAYDVSRGLTLEAEGSVRRLEDDFGWELTRSDDPDTLEIEARAVRRGDGWTAHGGVGFRAQSGTFTLRGTGWIRGGPDGLSPRAGSPPRVGVDGEATLRVVLFGGDLPLVAAAHGRVEGERTGTVHEPGWATVDVGLRADFGPAGGFLEYLNVFDRSAPSAIEDLETGRAVPMPGRSFHLGIVWYLLD